MTENPVKKLRTSAGISAVEFAIMCDCSTTNVREMELGNFAGLSERFRPGIESLGGNFVELQRGYEAFKLSRRAEIIAKVRKGTNK